MDNLVNAKTLAATLGITERRVNQLATDEGVFQRGQNGKFDLVKCVHDFYYDKYATDEKIDLDSERALHEKVKREKAEIQLAILRNELHKASDIELVMVNMLTTFRNKILSIPSKVAPKLIGQKNIAAISGVLEEELNEALAELSDYEPSMFTLEGEAVGEEDQETI